MFFGKKVNMSKCQSMVDFLTGHFRYSIMNSWNGCSSYANKTKVSHLGLTLDQRNKAYEVLGTDFWDKISYPIDEFTREMNGYYTIGSNGRSGGYLVLMNSHYEATGHKSYCRTCGQRNFKHAFDAGNFSPEEAIIMREVIKNGGIWTPETYLEQSAIQAISTRLSSDFTVDFEMSKEGKLAVIRKAKEIAKDCTYGNKCGACGIEGEMGRVNYAASPRRLAVTGKGIDQNEGFYKEDCSMQFLRDRVNLVLRFDRACDEIRENFIGLLNDCDVVDEIVMVPQTRKVLHCNCAGGL